MAGHTNPTVRHYTDSRQRPAGPARGCSTRPGAAGVPHAMVRRAGVCGHHAERPSAVLLCVFRLVRGDFPAPPSPWPEVSRSILLGYEDCFHLSCDVALVSGAQSGPAGHRHSMSAWRQAFRRRFSYHPPKREQRYPETRQISYHGCRCLVPRMAHAHGTERWHVPLGVPRGIACRGLPALAPLPRGTLLAL